MTTKIWILTALFLAGCRPQSMVDRFPEGKPKILTDESGRKYVVELHFINTYTVKPLDSRK